MTRYVFFIPNKKTSFSAELNYNGHITKINEYNLG